MSLKNHWSADLRRWLQESFPTDLCGFEVYILKESEAGQGFRSGTAYAWTGAGLDQRLRDRLEGLGLWYGPGFAVIVRDYFDGRNDKPILVHELAHWCEDQAAPLFDDEEIRFRILLNDWFKKLRNEGSPHAPPEPPKVDRPKWYQHEGPFIRAALHLASRAGLGLHWFPAAGETYDLSPLTAYAAALGDESRRLAGLSVAEILRLPAPAAFDELFAAEGLAKALMQYLESQGMAKTGANVRAIGGQVQTLFKGTNLQLSGLPALAKEGAGLAGKMTPEEQLAAFAKLTGSFDESTSATALRNFVSRLSTAGGSKDRIAALKKMGLSPEDVDFVGEDFDTVAGRLDQGVASIPEAKWAAVLKAIFEEAGVAPSLALMQGRGDVAKNVALQANLAGFAADVRESQAGPGAARRRLELTGELQAAQEANGYGLRSQAYQNALREAGRTDFQRYVAGGIFNLAAGLGASPEGSQATAQNIAFGGAFSSINGDANAFVDRRTQEAISRANDPAGFLARQQEESRKATERNTAVTEQLTTAIKGLAPRSVPAPGPRATSGAGRP